MAYQRIATHHAIFTKPLVLEIAWGNVEKLMALTRARIITETDTFPDDYRQVTDEVLAAGNLVPDAHVATILREYGVRRLYTADTDFRNLEFLEVVNPLRP